MKIMMIRIEDLEVEASKDDLNDLKIEALKFDGNLNPKTI